MTSTSTQVTISGNVGTSLPSIPAGATQINISSTASRTDQEVLYTVTTGKTFHMTWFVATTSDVANVWNWNIADNSTPILYGSFKTGTDAIILNGSGDLYAFLSGHTIKLGTTTGRQHNFSFGGYEI